MSRVEQGVLRLLMEHAGRTIDRTTLVRAVWGSAEVAPRTVDSVIKRLRARLGDTGALIRTVRGVGYRLDA